MKFFKPTSTEKTADFYGDLLAEKRNCLFWGRQRFDAAKALRSTSVQRCFRDPVAAAIGRTDRVIDVGCGPGIFFPLIAPLCRELVGLDSTPAFVARCRETIATFHLPNASVVEGSATQMPFADGSADAVIMVDLLHHLPDPEAALRESARVLKPGGRILVYEPNKLNPLLWLGCLIDRNEWGLLSLGRAGIYRRMLAPWYTLETVAYSGLIIGPDNRVVLSLAAVLNHPLLRPLLGWLNPKVRLFARRK